MIMSEYLSWVNELQYTYRTEWESKYPLMRRLCVIGRTGFLTLRNLVPLPFKELTWYENIAVYACSLIYVIFYSTLPLLSCFMTVHCHKYVNYLHYNEVCKAYFLFGKLSVTLSISNIISTLHVTLMTMMCTAGNWCRAVYSTQKS